MIIEWIKKSRSVEKIIVEALNSKTKDWVNKVNGIIMWKNQMHVPIARICVNTHWCVRDAWELYSQFNSKCGSVLLINPFGIRLPFTACCPTHAIICDILITDPV